MLRSIVIVTLLSTTAFAAAQQRISNYADLFKSLKAGKQVRVVAEYKKMKLFSDGKEEESVDATGGLTVGAWEQFAKGVVRNDKAYIGFSQTNLIAHPRYGHVHNYVRFRIFEDNSIEITARYLEASTYKVVMDETFKGKLSNGKDVEGVSFYR
ncbi:MAG: VirK family protein [Armatimonadota bacterium]